MAIFGSSFIIKSSTFTYNIAADNGGVIAATASTVNIVSSDFYANKAKSVGGMMITMSKCSTHITDCTFDHNSGSLFVFDSNITFSGYTKF